MIQAPGIALTLLAFVFLIGPLVFVHELGHYLVGRWFGVKAEAFAIGFGREIAGWTDKRGTRWKVGWLPLGGYVRFAGDMNPASQPSADWLALPAAERNRTFQAKPVWQRALIVAAGPAVNFIVAFVILTAFAAAFGDARTPATVAAVTPGSAAAAAGLRPGDRIVALGGREVATFDDIVGYVRIHPGERARLDYLRAGAEASTPVVIGATALVDRFGNRFRIGQLGVASTRPVIVPVSTLEAPGVALRRTGELLRFMGDTIGQIVTGTRSVKELSGPVGMARVAGQQFSLGLLDFINLVALVSLNLAIVNLLPIPMLDGGHLLFYAIEAVRRKPVEQRTMEWAFRGGLAAILALFAVVTFNDLGSAGLWHRLAGLIG